MAVEAFDHLVGALRGSVRVRITAAAVGVIGAVLLVGALSLVWGMHVMLTREARLMAALRAGEVARVVESGGDITGTALGEDAVVEVFGPSGNLLAASPDGAGRSLLPLLAPGESRPVRVPFDDDAFIAVAATASGGRTVVFARDLEPVTESTQALTLLLSTGLPALLALLGVTIWRVVGRALRPVDAMRAEVDLVSGGRLDRRLPRPATNDEIGRLADTMNRMLDRLDVARSRERGFVADASHELRSPISAIRQYAEVALAHPEHCAGLSHVAYAESIRMQILIDDLLVLAKADADALSLKRRPVDLDDLALAEAARLRDRKIAVDTHGVSAARVDGDPAALTRMLTNLGDNAARHSRGRIALTVSQRDGWAEVRVDDDGPGVAAADRIRVFERFVRLDEGRSRADGGSGLGLAIVAEIVTAHGGTAIITASTLGGARVIVRLPALTR